MIAIFGRNIGPAAISQAGSFPLPTDLGGTSAKITVAGQSSDLVMVYAVATQVGAIVPSNTPTGSGTITVTYNGQTSAALPVTVVASQLGIFTINQGGSGPAVVQNVNSEADRPVNTILNSARPGQAMILWGTGLGPIAGSDRGAPPVGDLNQSIEVLVAGRRANVLYKGRSGCCAGIDQIVFEVPGGVQGCYVPLVVKNGNSVSNYTSIAVAPTGGVCSDPFGYTANELNTANSAGKLNGADVSLTRLKLKLSVAGQTAESVQDTASGSFYSYDAAQLVSSRGSGGVALAAGTCTLFTFNGESTSPADPIQPRWLDAGSVINVAGPGGDKKIFKASIGRYSGNLGPGGEFGLTPFPVGPGASTYLTAGQYTIENGVGGVDVGGFRSSLTIPGNFVWTNEASTTVVNRSSDLNINWSGTDANGYVLVLGTSQDSANRVGATFFCLERGSSLRLTVPASILLALPASSVQQGVETGLLMVGVTTEPSRFTARGIDVGTFSFTSLSGKILSYR